MQVQFEDITADTASEVSNEIDRLLEKRSLRYGYNSLSRHLSFVLMSIFIHNTLQVWINLCLYAAYAQQLLTAKESATLVTAVGDSELCHGLVVVYS